MTKQIVLTEQEYETFIKDRADSEQLLQNDLAALEDKITSLKQQPKEPAPINLICSPFRVNLGVLSIGTPADFVTMYNNMAEAFSLVNLVDADRHLWDLMTKIADMTNTRFNLDTPATLKKYRVSLQKEGLYASIKKNRIITLVAIED